MKFIFLLLLLVHALLHSLGFVKAFGWVNVRVLKEPISKPLGWAWFGASFAYLLAAAMVALGLESWWIPGCAAMLVSQTLIFLFWRDARFGTLVNLVILVPLIVSVADALPTSYRNIYRAQVENGIVRYVPQPPVTEADLVPLPEPVRRYLRFAGAVGKPRIQNFRAVFTGQFRRSPESGWMDFRSVQHNFTDDATRLFFIQSHVAGIPFDGLHVYVGNRATMQIKVASLFQVVDARGDTMTRGETVTLFNDMCVMAPSTLIDTGIHWEPIDSLTVKGTFTNKGISISALLSFDTSGALIDFSSEDRFMSADGITYKNYRWTTPISEYRDIDGRRVASRAELIWHRPEGDYVYGKFDLESMKYNCSEAE